MMFVTCYGSKTSIMCHAVRYYIFADVNIYVLQIILNPAFKNRIVFAVKKKLNCRRPKSRIRLREDNRKTK